MWTLRSCRQSDVQDMQRAANRHNVNPLVAQHHFHLFQDARRCCSWSPSSTLLGSTTMSGTRFTAVAVVCCGCNCCHSWLCLLMSARMMYVGWQLGGACFPSATAAGHKRRNSSAIDGATTGFNRSSGAPHQEQQNRNNVDHSQAEEMYQKYSTLHVSRVGTFR